MKHDLSDVAVLALLIALSGGTGVTSGQLVHAPDPMTRPAIDPEKLLVGPDLAKEQQQIRRDMEGAIATAREPLDRAAAHIALANWLLAVPTAAPATRWILGEDHGEDRKALADSAAAALEHLADAEPLLKATEAAEAPSEKARRRRLVTADESLKAFAELFAAAGGAGTIDTQRGVWSEVASNLAESRESDNAQLASAATLWQAMAWNQAGRRERALAGLPEALARPEHPYDFMSRILRCRIISDAGQHAAAMALCTQIRSYVDDWYPRERTLRHHARVRLIGLLQFRISQVWAKGIGAQTRPADAELLREFTAELIQDVFPPGDAAPEVFMMETALPPALIKSSSIRPTTTAEADRPATRPN